MIGLFEHRKGGRYLAFGPVRVATNAQDGEKVIVYLGFSGWWVRAVDEFLDGRFEPLFVWGSRK